MRKIIFLLILSCILSYNAIAQNTTIEGYVFENDNHSYLNLVQVKIFNEKRNQLLISTLTSDNGYFSAQLPAGKNYLIETNKDKFHKQTTKIFTKKKDKNKKVFTKIKMGRIAEEQFVDKNGETRRGEMVMAVNSYGIDAKKIVPDANPSGVRLSDLVSFNDPYAEVTNATRLTEDNYGKVSDREMMKTQKMPTAYSIPAISEEKNTFSETLPQQHRPTAYETAAATRKIMHSNKFGETIVSFGTVNKARTESIPTNYTGYKIEFVTSMVELAANHKIFSQHGNIAMEEKSNGVYSYLLGNYRHQKEAEIFLKEVIKLRYANANLVYYSNGKRGQTVTSKIKTKTVSAPPR